MTLFQSFRHHVRNWSIKIPRLDRSKTFALVKAEIALTTIYDTNICQITNQSGVNAPSRLLLTRPMPPRLPMQGEECAPLMFSLIFEKDIDE